MMRYMQRYPELPQQTAKQTKKGPFQFYHPPINPGYKNSHVMTDDKTTLKNANA